MTTHRPFIPAGRSSLIIPRYDLKNVACSLDDLSAQESPEDYRVAIGGYALRSGATTEQVLINFENSRGMSDDLASISVRCSP